MRRYVTVAQFQYTISVELFECAVCAQLLLFFINKNWYEKAHVIFISLFFFGLLLICLLVEQKETKMLNQIMM